MRDKYRDRMIGRILTTHPFENVHEITLHFDNEAALVIQTTSFSPGDEDGQAMPQPGEALRRGHVEIFYKDGRHVRSVQRVTVLPPTSEDFCASGNSATMSGKLSAAAAATKTSSSAPLPTGSPATEQGFEDSDLDTGSDGGQPFDLDNFHPRSGVLEATRAMVASGKFETEQRWDENVGSHVMVKPRVGSFNGESSERRISHSKNSSMPHLGPEQPPEELEEELEEEQEVQRRVKGPSDRRLSHSKARSASDKVSLTTKSCDLADPFEVIDLLHRSAEGCEFHKNDEIRSYQPYLSTRATQSDPSMINI